jgi:hypothetical protein
MKELTRAYEDGDLARLLAFEEAWNTAASTPSSDLEQRCQHLEQTNRELRAQLRTLDRELRDLRRSPLADLPPIELIVAAAEAEIEDLEITRDFIRDFRDGKISLRRFVEGPEVMVADEIAELERYFDGSSAGRSPMDAFDPEPGVSPRGPRMPHRRKRRTR